MWFRYLLTGVASKDTNKTNQPHRGVYCGEVKLPLKLSVKSPAKLPANHRQSSRCSYMGRLLTLLLCLCSLTGIQARAQLPATVSATTQVSLVTVFPGDPVYTMFGHSAIRFVDPVSGLDASFNYGTFDFDRTFVFRFASGRLDYRLSVTPSEPAFRHYERENRTIVEQVLNLDSTEVQVLYELLLVNYRPENRYYRYDFFFDNCSTRIRDIIEVALADQIAATGNPGESYRDLLKPYIGRRPLLASLMNVGLGASADADASPRDYAFLPVELIGQFASTTLADGRPLVATTDTLHVADPAPPSRVTTAVVLTWLVVVLAILVSISRHRRGLPRRRWVDSVVFGLSGLAGMLLAYLWFGSEHAVARNNLNLMWAAPTHLVAAVAVLKRHLPAWLRVYLTVTGVAAVVFICGLSWWTQEIHPLVFPIVVLIAFRAGRCLTSAANRPA